MTDIARMSPCPFCGGDPYMHVVDYCEPPEWTVLCLNGDCLESRATRDEAIAIWNRRSGHDRLVAEVARLREALRFYADPAVYKAHPHGPAFDGRDLSFVARAALEQKSGCEGAK